MAGLLSAFTPKNGYGLLSPYRTNDPFLQSLLDRVRMPQADAADEAMFARNPNGSGGMEPVPAQTQPDLNSALMSAQRVAQSPIQNAAPAVPQRGRVSGWRVLDRVLGGETVTGGLDAERARLQAEAAQPAALERQARLQRLVDTMSPAEQIAFATNPGEFGKALASNSEGYTLGAGGIRGGRDGIVASAPTYSTVNDTIYANDRGVSTPTATAAPGYDDLTNRAKQESDARLAALGIGIQQQNANTTQAVGLGNLGVAQERLGLDREKVAAEATTRQAAQSANQGGAQIVAQNMATALSRARQLAGAAGYWNGHAPILGQINAQKRADLEGQLDTLKGNLTFDKLMEMKRTSPTGASGLGALSDNEARLLASTVAALNVDMSPDELERSFQRVDEVIARAAQAPSGGQGGGQIAVNPQTGERVQWNGSAWVPM